MKKIRLFLLFGVLNVWTIVSCSHSGSDTDRVESGKNNDAVNLTSQQVKNAGIELGKITPRLLSMDIHAKGKLVLPPQNLAFVCTSVAGSIERIFVQQGSYVSKGAAMIELVSPELIRLQQEFISTQTRLKVVEQDFDRQQSLARDKITSDKLLQEVGAQYQELKSKYASLELQLELMNISMEEVRNGMIRKSAIIKAPISGYIDRCMIHPGQYAEPNAPLMELVDNNRLILELMVFEKDVRHVKVGQRVSFELVNLGGEEFDARVASIGKMVEEGARTVKILADFTNNDPSVLPGMFVAAEIHTDEQNLDALPEEAVVADENESYCYYTEGKDGATSFGFYKLPVKTGFKEDGYIQVEPMKSLPADARIVIKGTYFIKAEELKQLDEAE